MTRKITKKRAAEITKEMLEALDMGNPSDYSVLSGSDEGEEDNEEELQASPSNLKRKRGLSGYVEVPVGAANNEELADAPRKKVRRPKCAAEKKPKRATKPKIKGKENAVAGSSKQAGNAAAGSGKGKGKAKAD